MWNFVFLPGDRSRMRVFCCFFSMGDRIEFCLLVSLTLHSCVNPGFIVICSLDYFEEKLSYNFSQMSLVTRGVAGAGGQVALRHF